MNAAAPFDTADPALAQLRRLTEISRALTYTTSMEQVTRLTVERGAELLDAHAAVLMLADAEGLLHVRAAHGIDEERVARFRAPLSDEVPGRLPRGRRDAEWETSRCVASSAMQHANPPHGAGRRVRQPP